jgi:energy-coupling factor transporter ATP-binding protein EcfA2
VHFRTGRVVDDTYLPVGQIRDLWYARQIRSGNVWTAAEIHLEYVDGTKLSFELRNLFNNVQSRLTAAAVLPSAIDDRIARRPPVLVPPSVGIVTQEEYRTPARQVGLIATGRNNEIVRNLLYDLKTSRNDAYKKILDLLQKHLNATLADVRFDQAKDQYVDVTYSEGSYTHELFAVGSGFVQMVQLLAFALRGQPGLLLLDEPDAHLHSSLQHVVVDILESLARETGEQVLLATHSKEIINYVDPERIIPVSKTEARLQPLAPYTAPITLLEKLGNVDNVDLAWLIRNRKCLFVEGDDDKYVLRRFAGKLGSAVFEGDSQAVIIPIKGVDRENPLVELDAFEKLLGKKVSALMIRDRDGLPDAEVRELETKFKRPLHVLGRSAIESYLLDVGAISRLIQTTKGKTAVEATADAEGLLAQAMEEAKNVTMDTIATQLSRHDYAMGRQRRDAGVYAGAARAHVESEWATPEGRLRVVDGKEALARLRDALRLMGISAGTATLIDAIPQVPDEITNLIKRIEKL